MRSLGIVLVFILAFTSYSQAQSFNQLDDSGRKEGKWVKYFDNRKMKYEGQFRNDMPFGKFIHYYNTGDVKAIVVFSDDGIIGRSTTYYKNGKLMAEGKFINEQKDSVWRYYLNEATNPLISTETYVNGELHGESITYYTETGDPAEIVVYEDGRKNGKLIKYFPDGILMTESYYKNGVPDGDFKHYHPDGKIQILGSYKNGLQLGNWKYYDESGKQVDEEEFLKQEEVKEINEAP